MKKATIILTGVIMMSIAAINANAQNTATQSADASATILQHLTLVKNVDLAFGGIITDTDGGTVVIEASEAGGPTYNGLPSQLAAETSASKFTANGQADATFAITLPASTSLSDGASHTMTVNNFVSSVGVAGVVLTDGIKEFYVGATLNIGAAQAAGIYTGSFPVTVTYE